MCGMMKELKFVDVGEGITEGNIHKWLVKDNDNVKEDQPVVEIETDKAVVNIPSPITGKIKIISNPGSVKVGDILAYFGTSDELKNIQKAQATTDPAVAAKSTPITDAVKSPAASDIVKSAPAPDAKNINIQAQSSVLNNEIKSKDILATPSVRKLAHELNVDLNGVVGTGPSGRILENDVRTHVRENSPIHTVPIYSESKEEIHKDRVERIPMSQIRKAIARNMELSWTIPRAVHMDLIDATYLAKVLEKEKPKLAKKNIKLTFLPFIIKAVVTALKENERFNSSYDKEKQEIIVKRYYNIGIAAEAEDGLRVAVIKDVDKKSISTIAKEIQELAAKVRNKTISIDEMSDTTFTITNIGSLGGGYLSVPMINYPDVAILGIHLVRDVPMVKDNQIVIGKQLPFSLTFDHRVVDGAEAVKFGNLIKEYIEDPEFLELSD